jgi:hypothetical protein
MWKGMWASHWYITYMVRRKRIGERVAWRWSDMWSYGHGLMMRGMYTSLFLLGCCQSHKGGSSEGVLERCDSLQAMGPTLDGLLRRMTTQNGLLT